MKKATKQRDDAAFPVQGKQMGTRSYVRRFEEMNHLKPAELMFEGVIYYPVALMDAWKQR